MRLDRDYVECEALVSGIPMGYGESGESYGDSLLYNKYIAVCPSCSESCVLTIIYVGYRLNCDTKSLSLLCPPDANTKLTRRL